MNQPSSSPMGRYQAQFRSTPGFFFDEAIACWDFLLAAQTAMKVPGNMLEIGVFRGKSAFLAACHMRAPQVLVLNDISPIDDVVSSIRSLNGPEPLAVLSKSFNLATNPDLRRFHGTMRWIHIDGDHAAFNAMADLLTAETFLGEKGILCVDDFFNIRYPQVTASVYRFLEQRNPIYRLFLCGAHKAYICRSDDFALYEALVAKYLAGHLQGAGITATIHKSTYSFDYGCFSVGPREQDRDYIGLDSDAGAIPA